MQIYNALCLPCFTDEGFNATRLPCNLINTKIKRSGVLCRPQFVPCYALLCFYSVNSYNLHSYLNNSYPYLLIQLDWCGSLLMHELFVILCITTIFNLCANRHFCLEIAKITIWLVKYYVGMWIQWIFTNRVLVGFIGRFSSTRSVKLQIRWKHKWHSFSVLWVVVLST